MNTMNVAITAEQEATIKKLLKTRPGVTERELIQSMFNLGCYQVNYRTEQNKRNGEEKKLFRAWVKEQREKAPGGLLKGSETVEEVR